MVLVYKEVLPLVIFRVRLCRLLSVMVPWMAITSPLVKVWLLTGAVKVKMGVGSLFVESLLLWQANRVKEKRVKAIGVLIVVVCVVAKITKTLE